MSSNVIKQTIRSYKNKILFSVGRTFCNKCDPNINIKNINPYIVNMEVPSYNNFSEKIRELESKLQDKKNKLPFKNIIRADIRDPQALKQPYITFAREVLALLCYRPLIRDPEIPIDAKMLAHFMKKHLRHGSIGSETHKLGLNVIRQNIATYISRRDEIPCDRNDIHLISGTTDGVRTFIKLLNGPKDKIRPSVLVPRPNTNLYSCLIQTFGMKDIIYHLDESSNWLINLEHLKQKINSAREKTNPRALIILNPYAFTGTVLPLSLIRDIIHLANEERLIIIADETYQQNIYSTNKFHSFRKAVLGFRNKLQRQEVASVMSCSEAYLAECGLRSGYMELLNIKPEIQELYYNTLRTNVRTSVLGQVMLGILTHPPHSKQDIYEDYQRELKAIQDSLKRRAEFVTKEFNSIDGFWCSAVEAGVCAFVRFEMPQGAKDAASQAKQPPDEFFVYKLLEQTGVAVIPGSSLGYSGNNFYFCSSILPPIDDLRNMMLLIKQFYISFNETYA